MKITSKVANKSELPSRNSPPPIYKSKFRLHSFETTCDVNLIIQFNSTLLSNLLNPHFLLAFSIPSQQISHSTVCFSLSLSHLLTFLPGFSTWILFHNRMQLLVNDDSTTLSYWLNWRVFLCAIWVLTPMVVASFLIWKYEYSGSLKTEGGRTEEENSSILHHRSWKPCLKEIHPVFLLVFRITAFCLLLVALSVDVAIHGFELFYYYTQWTFTLTTIYFGFGSVLSIHGCYHHLKINSCWNTSDHVEQGLYVPIAHEANGNGLKLLEKLDHPGKSHTPLTGFWDNLFQVLYQMTAGAVTITDMVYWCVIFPFIALRDYEMNFLTVVTHSLNAILLLGDTALNSLQFPWFGISYFILLTGIYVVFQWVVHASVSMWWPYPFLQLSAPLAPLWYLVVAVMHVPCYGIFLLIVKVKHALFSRLFPHSYRFCP